MNLRYFAPVPADQVRRLPSPALAMQMLRSSSIRTDIHVEGLFGSFQRAFEQDNESDTWPLLERVSDAWAWLVANGLVGERVDPHGGSRQMRRTALGKKAAENASALSEVWASNRLSGELHPLLEDRVRTIFYLGDYETAVFAAFKVVEVEVRRLANCSNDVIGVALMRSAFGREGPLVDPQANAGETVATMELFAGAIGTFKNPASHRTVRFEDPVEAAESIQMADLLLRLLNRIEQRQSAAATS